MVRTAEAGSIPFFNCRLDPPQVIHCLTYWSPLTTMAPMVTHVSFRELARALGVHLGTVQYRVRVGYYPEPAGRHIDRGGIKPCFTADQALEILEGEGQNTDQIFWVPLLREETGRQIRRTR